MAELSNMSIENVVRESGLSHIAFIMDGNGRWAKKRLMPREMGHRAGSETFRRIMHYCKDIGIKYATVYAFSTENIKRPRREVEAIFDLFFKYITEAKDERDIEFRFLGEPALLSEQIGERCRELEESTRGRPFRLNVAFNYGGRAEIVHAVNKLLRSGKTEVTEEDLSAEMYTRGCPDPDLIVRTSGEVRTSNFLLWQSAYSEYYFTDKLWPDLTPRDVDEAILCFASRSRRRGGLDPEKTN